MGPPLTDLAGSPPEHTARHACLPGSWHHCVPELCPTGRGQKLSLPLLGLGPNHSLPVSGQISLVLMVILLF